MLAMVNPDMENFKPDFLRGINLLKTVIVSGLSGNCLQVNQKMSWDHAFRSVFETNDEERLAGHLVSASNKWHKMTHSSDCLMLNYFFEPYPYLIKRAMAQTY